MQVRKQQLELTWNNRLVPNQERSTSRLYVYCHPAYLISMLGISWKMLGWMTHKLDADDTTLMTESKEELKNLLIKVQEESKKAGLKFNIQKPLR